MMAEPENLVPEHLRAMRGEMAKMADYMHTMSVEMTAMRQHLAGVVTIQDDDHVDIAAIKQRLDKIERRLELAD
jgi:hypothetical protein